MVIILILCNVISCNRLRNNNHNIVNRPKGIVAENVTLQESFTDFIGRFHADAEFLHSRLADSVTGFNSNNYTLDSDSEDIYVWSRAEIADYMLRDVETYFEEAQTVVKYDMADDSTVFETIEIPNSSCFVSVKYKADNGKWYMAELWVNLL